MSIRTRNRVDNLTFNKLERTHAYFFLTASVNIMLLVNKMTHNVYWAERTHPNLEYFLVVVLWCWCTIGGRRNLFLPPFTLPDCPVRPNLTDSLGGPGRGGQTGNIPTLLHKVSDLVLLGSA